MLKNFATLRKRGFVKFLEKDQHLDPLNFYLKQSHCYFKIYMSAKSISRGMGQTKTEPDATGKVKGRG